jgi:hypothetical protein
MALHMQLWDGIAHAVVGWHLLERVEQVAAKRTKPTGQENHEPPVEEE